MKEYIDFFSEYFFGTKTNELYLGFVSDISKLDLDDNIKKDMIEYIKGTHSISHTLGKSIPNLTSLYAAVGIIVTDEPIYYLLLLASETVRNCVSSKNKQYKDLCDTIVKLTGVATIDEKLDK